MAARKLGQGLEYLRYITLESIREVTLMEIQISVHHTNPLRIELTRKQLPPSKETKVNSGRQA